MAGVDVAGATTSVAASSSSSTTLVSQPVTLSAVVTAADGSVPTGTVTFADAGTVLGTASLDSGRATLAASFTAAGSHVVTASYSGDAGRQASSGSFSQAVNRWASSTTLTTATARRVVRMTATVRSSWTGHVPTGTVTFRDGTTVLGSVAPSSAGVATLAPTFRPGTHSLKAVYSGDPVQLASTSATVGVTVR